MCASMCGRAEFLNQNLKCRWSPPKEQAHFALPIRNKTCIIAGASHLNLIDKPPIWVSVGLTLLLTIFSVFQYVGMSYYLLSVCLFARIRFAGRRIKMAAGGVIAVWVGVTMERNQLMLCVWGGGGCCSFLPQVLNNSRKLPNFLQNTHDSLESISLELFLGASQQNS